MKASGPGPERFVLSLALLVPLAITVLALSQLPATSLAFPSGRLLSDPDTNIVSRRPASSISAPPPTLALTTATPRPTATPVPPTPAPTLKVKPQTPTTYVVQPGDELKHIAADHGISIWKIIAANDIPDPDSLRIGQQIRIPAD